MAKKSPQMVVQPEVAPEAVPGANQPISFAEPAAQVADGAEFSEQKPDGFEDPISDRDMQKLRAAAERDNRKRDFHDKVMEARKPIPEPAFVPIPLAPRIVEQRNAELAAGAAMVARNAEQQAQRRSPTPEPTDGTHASVFRPGDYVPDQKKGQGNVQASTLSGSASA